MANFIKGFDRKLPLGTKVEMWTEGQDYRTFGSVVHGTTQVAYGHANLQRPPAPPNPPTNPPPVSFVPVRDQLYSVFFTTEFTKDTVGKVKITLVATLPNGTVFDSAKIFDVSGTRNDGPAPRIVVFETRKT